MLHRLILTCLAVAAAQPALALSCLRPDVIRLYSDARDSEDLYSMVVGKITATNPIAIPKKDNGGSTKADTTVRVTGRSLTSSGFTAPFDRDVTLRASCLSVWCADPPTLDTEVFLTLRHDGDARVVDIGPCPFNALPWSADEEARVLNCHRFDRCSIAE